MGRSKGFATRRLQPDEVEDLPTTTVPAYSGRETSSSPPVPLRRVASMVAPSIGSASVPVAIVGLQSQQVLLQGGSAVAEGAALGERRHVAAPPAAWRLAPRSVSPVARLRIS